jgi:hypothetical protein
MLLVMNDSSFVKHASSPHEIHSHHTEICVVDLSNDGNILNPQQRSTCTGIRYALCVREECKMDGGCMC